MEEARGDGRGVSGPRQGLGPPSKCVCPQCGYSVAKTAGTPPCTTKTCPDCGVALQGQD